MSRRNSRRSHQTEGKHFAPQGGRRQEFKPQAAKNTADAEEPDSSPGRDFDGSALSKSGLYPAATVDYGADEGPETFTPRLDAYFAPAAAADPDPYGDDLFAGFEPGFRPDASAVHEISVMVRWGIPPRMTEFHADFGPFQPGDTVLVETEKGQFYGDVVSAGRIVPRGRAEFPRKVLRLATAQDLEMFEKHRKMSVEAFAFANTRIRQLGLDMKLFTVFVLASGDKMMFYFTSDARVDFRRLVRDLAARFSMRIEMRQMGPRDDSRITGGLGICGKELCCAAHLNRFIPVSIRMAKDQNLVLNPQNISGQCGRLKCCLAYEQEFYQELREGMPKVGKRIELPEGMARVQDVNLLTGQVRVLFENGVSATYSREQMMAFQKGREQEAESSPVPESDSLDGLDPEPEM